MPKRSRSVVTPSPAKRSKLKPSVDQPSIVDFFNVPPKSKGMGAAIPSPEKVPRPKIIDVDLFEAEAKSDIPAESLRLGPSKQNPQSKMISHLPSTIHSSTPIDNSFIHVTLTSDSTTYTPHPRPWSSTGVPYSFLAHTLTTISQTRSRITIINTLTNSLRTIISHDPASLLPALYLLSNTLAPPYATVEMGLGPSLISRSIQQVSGLTPIALKRLYNDTGDVGDVAFSAKSNLRTLLPHPPLLVKFVYTSLLNIAQCKGQGAAKAKQRIVEKLLIAANGEEIRFLARTLSQNLRVGAVRMSILTALSRAMVLTPLTHFSHCSKNSIYHTTLDLISRVKPLVDKGKVVDSARDEIYAKFTQAENVIKRVYVQHPNYEALAAALLEVGLDGLENKVTLSVGE
jgi:DNA ligase-1